MDYTKSVVYKLKKLSASPTINTVTKCGATTWYLIDKLAIPGTFRFISISGRSNMGIPDIVDNILNFIKTTRKNEFVCIDILNTDHSFLLSNYNGKWYITQSFIKEYTLRTLIIPNIETFVQNIVDIEINDNKSKCYDTFYAVRKIQKCEWRIKIWIHCT